MLKYKHPIKKSIRMKDKSFLPLPLSLLSLLSIRSYLSALSYLHFALCSLLFAVALALPASNQF
jgi:hypothetical protein